MYLRTTTFYNYIIFIMSQLTNIPLQDNYKSTLSQAWDGNVWTIYVNTVPSFTFPSWVKTYICVDPWKTNMQVARISAYDATLKTITVDNITLDKGNGVAYTAQTHTVWSVIEISDNYQFREDILTAINSKVNTNSTDTDTWKFANATARDAYFTSPVNWNTAYLTTEWYWTDYIAWAWVSRATGSTPNASTTVAGKVEKATSWEVTAWTATGWTGAELFVWPAELKTVTELQHWIDTAFNYTIWASRDGNAETVSLLTKAWTVPSATDPVHIAFRNVIATTGDYTIATVSSALTIVINNTATMWATNAVPFRLWLVAFNTAGTVSLGIVNTQLSTGGIFPLNTDSFASSTTIGTGSDSAGVIYSTAWVTAKAYQILWYLDYTLAAIGVWDTAPTKIQMYGRGVKLPWQLIQKIESVVTTSSTGTNVLPYDNTIPQNTEWDQYLTATITPTAWANKLWIESSCTISNNSATTFSSALFQGSTVWALAARGWGASVDVVSDLRIDHTMVAGTTSATTFNIRAWGSWAWTTTFNGTAGARVLWWALNSYIKISEIMV